MTETAMSEDLLEGAAQIASFIWGEGADRRRAYRVIESGRLPTFRIGKRLYARKSTIAEWIKRQEARAVSESSRVLP